MISRKYRVLIGCLVSGVVVGASSSSSSSPQFAIAEHSVSNTSIVGATAGSSSQKVEVKASVALDKLFPTPQAKGVEIERILLEYECWRSASSMERLKGLLALPVGSVVLPQNKTLFSTMIDREPLPKELIEGLLKHGADGTNLLHQALTRIETLTEVRVYSTEICHIINLLFSYYPKYVHEPRNFLEDQLLMMVIQWYKNALTLSAETDWMGNTSSVSTQSDSDLKQFFLAIIKTLLKLGAEITYKNKDDHDALYYAHDLSAVEDLLKTTLKEKQLALLTISGMPIDLVKLVGDYAPL